MNLNDAFPSKYLKASDFPEEGDQEVTIERIALEEIGRDRQTKPVIYFEEFQAGLVCNVTNARVIARVLESQEFDDWIGRKITLYRTETDFQGDIVDAIRIRTKPRKGIPPLVRGSQIKPPQQAKPAPALPAKMQPPDDDEIPF